MINLSYCVYLVLLVRREKTRLSNIESATRWNKLHPERRKEIANRHAKKIYAQNPEKKRAATKQWRLDNPEKYVASYTNPKNRKRQCERSKAYRLSHPDAVRKANIASKRLRYARDPIYRATMSMRCRIRQALKGTNKSVKSMELLGSSATQFRQHIEKQFVLGMSWKNYGLWHIDHIKPCAKFDLADPAQQRECFHFSNLQPLWAKDNLFKGDKYGN